MFPAILAALDGCAHVIGWVVMVVFAVGFVLAIPAVWQSWPRRPFWN